MAACAAVELAGHQLPLQLTDNDTCVERIRYAAIAVEDEEYGQNHEEELEKEDKEEEEEEEEEQSFLLSLHIDEPRREEGERRTKEAVGPEWVFLLQRKLLMEPQLEKKSSGINGSCSIHRVPDCFRQQGDDSYVHQIISIGPLHRKKESLQSMEEHQMKYLRDVVSCTQLDSREAQSKILEKCLIKAKLLENEARECYSEEIDLDSNKFVEMMVVDGCFIIGLLCKVADKIRTDASDPIF